MAQNIPAMRGQMGSTEYYLVTMKASEFVRTVTIPKEMEGWESLSADEKFQRDINYTRVKKFIAPYLAQDPDRFFGSFIVTVKNHESMIFSSLNDMKILKDNPMLPKSFGEDLGVLILDEQVLIPLDGQHRLAALKMAISGNDNNDREIPGIVPNSAIGSDYVSVILVRDDLIKSRKIFNKVNRYAKATSAADNLITSDDDYIAILCRNEIIGGLIDGRIVNIKSNTLSEKTGEFATLKKLHEISKRLVEYQTETKIRTDQLPSAAEQQIWKNSVIDFWDKFLELEAYKQSLLDSSELKDGRRAEIRKNNLCCKPIVMEAIAEATNIIRYTSEDGTRPPLKIIVEKLNALDWSSTNELWSGILLQTGGEKVITGTTAMKFAARFIAYLIGHKFEAPEIKALKRDFALNTGGRANVDGEIVGGSAFPEQSFT